MAKGRNRKFGIRQPNGQLRRPTLAELTSAEANTRMKEISIVIAQPHRRDLIDPNDPWAASAVGRFLLPRRSKAIGAITAAYDAADAYRSLYRRWWALRGVQDVIHDARVTVGSSPDLSPSEQADKDERVRADGARIGRIKLNIIRMTHIGYCVMNNAIMFDVDVPAMSEDDAMTAFGQLAEEMGLSGRPLHPFRASLKTDLTELNE